MFGAESVCRIRCLLADAPKIFVGMRASRGVDKEAGLKLWRAVHANAPDPIEDQELWGGITSAENRRI
jgi:hypothetical protein